MPPINVLIKPSSDNCNLRCKYCFYNDIMSKRNQGYCGFMTENTLEVVIRQVLIHAEGECTIAYQGGEPTLSGLAFFEKSMELQKKYNVNHVKIHNALQTNGYNIDRKWAEFFSKNNFLVGISLDGIPKLHDCYRQSINGEGSFYKAMETIELFRRYAVNFNILAVVNGKTAPQIKRNYEFYRKNHLDYLQFIACLDPIGEEPGQKEYSLTPEIYGTFLIELFGLWYQDLKRGKQPYIRQFENYIGMLLGMAPEACDMRGVCGLQYVVEADGSVYPCDFYVSDEYKLGNLHQDTVTDMDKMRKKINFIEVSEKHDEACTNCRHYVLCRSGCRRNRQAAEPYRQYFCSSYLMFFDACMPKMLEIAKEIYRHRSGMRNS